MEPNQAAVSGFLCVSTFLFCASFDLEKCWLITYYIDIHTSPVWVQSSQWGSSQGESGEGSEISQGV